VAARVLPGLQRRLDKFLHQLSNGNGLPLPSCDVLYRSWLLRRNCPLRMLSGGQLLGRPDARYWTPDLYENPGLSSSPEFQEFRRYNSIARAGGEYGKKATAMVRVKLGKVGEFSNGSDELRDYLGPDELDLVGAIQDMLLNQIDQRGIVIEVCPTSNLYVARLKGYEEHPVFRWRPPDPALLCPGATFNKYGLRRGPVAVCLNTDDPAIFPTTIAAEHFLIKEAAIRHHGVSRAAADNWIDEVRAIGVGLFRRTNRKTDLRPGIPRLTEPGANGFHGTGCEVPRR
jgi:hypothetical protein